VIVFELLLQTRALSLSAGQFRFRCGRSGVEFSTAFFIGATTRRRAVEIKSQRSELFAVLLALTLDAIAAPRALAMLALHLLDGFALLLNFIHKFVQLLLKRACVHIQLGELAGQHNAQLGAHLVTQLGVALGLRRLALQ